MRLHASVCRLHANCHQSCSILDADVYGNLETAQPRSVSPLLEWPSIVTPAANAMTLSPKGHKVFTLISQFKSISEWTQ